MTTAKVADGAVNTAKVADAPSRARRSPTGPWRLSDLSTVSGDATVDPDPLAAQSCAIVEANAAAIRANDRPIFQVPAGLEMGSRPRP